MRPSDRSVAITLIENAEAINRWRDTLPEKDRRRLNTAQANVHRWQKSLQPQAKPDALAQAQAALARFLACIEALPPDQAAPLWLTVQEQAARRLT
jgi:DNA-directed RNA polymerase specialized sigma24 family protein